MLDIRVFHDLQLHTKKFYEHLASHLDTYEPDVRPDALITFRKSIASYSEFLKAMEPTILREISVSNPAKDTPAQTVNPTTVPPVQERGSEE